MGRFSFHGISAVAELERDIIVKRTNAELKAVRARGRVGGRKPMDPKAVKRMLALYDSRELSMSEICDTMGVTKSTLYKYVNERKARGNAAEA